MSVAATPTPQGYPHGHAARDRFVLERRRERPRHDPFRHQGLLIEEEPTVTGAVVGVATVFLTGRECPWRCAMCDLWRFTTVEDTPAGAIPTQLDLAISELEARRDGRTSSVMKLYNASNFFDPRAVPHADYDEIARRLARFSRVIVESHPSLVGPAVDRLQEALARHPGPGSETVTLEVAMGLETAHPDALERLHKRMSLARFSRAAGYLRARAAALRVFLLVHPPFLPREKREEWLVRSVEFAFDAGASAISLIPTRSGNGTLEALALQGQFEAPALADLERAVSLARERARGRVFADLWDLERLATCPRCFADRVFRLRLQNLEQRARPPVTCGVCGGSAS